MNADWRQNLLDDVMGFILDTVHGGRVPDLELIQQNFSQVKEDSQLRAEVESILEMHQWFEDSVGDWEDSVAATHIHVRETTNKTLPRMGTRWGDFLLVEELGRGGMGEVFKAWQISKRRFVAIKRLDSRLLEDEQARERFQKEPEHMMGIKHRGIVRVLEVGEHAGQPYFGMELVDGVSLGVLARSQALPPDQIAKIMLDVTRSVSVAHKAGILHRDLKPDNILLTRELEPKVTDFGLAKDLGRDAGLTRSLDVLGTCNYMPPEQAAGKSDQITERTDVYGLGAVLYELLTARPPFRGENAGEVLHRVQDAEPVAPRTINPLADEKLEAICLKCLEKNPEARYGSATELADEFERVLNGKRPLAPFNSLARRMWRFCRRRPAVASLFLVLILSAIGLSAAGVIAQRQTERAQREALRAEGESLRAERASVRAQQEAMRVEQERLEEIQALGIGSLNLDRIPASRFAALARHAAATWVQTIERMIDDRRIATLVAFAHVYEATAMDDALDVLDMLITEITHEAERIRKKERLRAIRDLDDAALQLLDACTLILEETSPHVELEAIFSHVARHELEQAAKQVKALAQPSDVIDRYGRVRRFLPKLLSTIEFQETPTGQGRTRHFVAHIRPVGRSQ